MIQKKLEIAEIGFHKLTQQASRMTISKPGVVEKLSARGPTIDFCRHYGMHVVPCRPTNPFGLFGASHTTQIEDRGRCRLPKVSQ